MRQTVSERLCAVSIDLGLEKILIVSVYMPCDLGCVTSVDDYEEELGYLDGLIHNRVY